MNLKLKKIDLKENQRKELMNTKSLSNNGKVNMKVAWRTESK